jgi:predicted transcriptional regulator
MDEWIRWALGVVCLLVGALYAQNQYQLRRLSRNIHNLRSMVQTVIISLAAHGIVIRRDDDELE